MAATGPARAMGYVHSYCNVVGCTCSLLGVPEEHIVDGRGRRAALAVGRHGQQPEAHVPLQPAHRPRRLLRRQVYSAGTTRLLIRQATYLAYISK